MFKPKSLDELNAALMTKAEVEVTVDGKNHRGFVVSTGPANSLLKEVRIELKENGVKKSFILKGMRVGIQ